MTPARTQAEMLARFVARSRFDAISPEAVAQLKIRVLDSLGTAMGALASPPMLILARIQDELGGNPAATRIGDGARGGTAADRAAFFNGALVRYLDFNDSFLAPGETCHPSDNLSAVLAASELRDASGGEFLTALATAYQVQIRLSEAAPVRARGFDHTTQGAFSAAAGASRALGLDASRTAHALAMSGASSCALRVTRTGRLSNWKGLAFPHVASVGTHCALLAMHGITGPLEVFEGNKGFMESVSGPFRIDWESEDLEAVRRTILKRHNAEIHSQSAIDAALELRPLVPNLSEGAGLPLIERIELDVFQVAFDIIGGGEEGDKVSAIRTKEEADHSLPYLVAVALLDGEVLPRQFEPERIARQDVQRLMRRVRVRPDSALTREFPRQLPVRLRLFLTNGRVLAAQRTDYEGFLTRPMSWEAAERKFHLLAGPSSDESRRSEIIESVKALESIRIRELTSLLTHPQKPRKRSPLTMTAERAFSFIPINPRPEKPRNRGITEIRGPYYSAMGLRALSDALETMGRWIDGLKFAGGSFALMPRDQVKAMIDLAHEYEVYVSTGGFIERVLLHGPELVDRYIDEAAELGFDLVELSTGFITLPSDDLLRLIERVRRAGMKAKPELGIQFGAGGATPAAELEAEGTRDVGWLITQARRCLDAGASIIMIESEGITESVRSWRTDVIARIVDAIGLEKVMFEAAEPAVFEWYVKNYGNEVNLFVDHSQIVQLEALRSGIWGTKSSWGRITSYPSAAKLRKAAA